LTDKQEIAWKEINRKETKALLYGGAKGGGKSYLLCIWFFSFCLWVISEYKLKPSKNPPHIGWIGRKQATDFTMTTLQTWYDVIPDSMYEIKGGTERQPRHILINKTVALDYGGLDRTEDINKFNSAEYGVIGIDQAEEVSKDDVAVLRGSLRLTINGRPLPYKEFYTANPRQCWLKQDFIELPKPRHKFVQALPAENPHLPDTYIDTLKDAFSHRPELLEAYLRGSWDALEGADQIIKSRWLSESMGRKLIGFGKRPRLVIDTARFGDDETVMYYMEVYDVLEQWIMPYCRSTEISNKAAAISKQHNNCPVVVEATGADLGAAVIDELTELGVPTILYNPQGEPDDKDKYYNMRAEAWSISAINLSKCKSEFNNECMSENDILVLRNQLCTPTYKFRNGKTLVEPKKEIKDRIGRSPDRGDCWVIGQWSYEKVPLINADTPPIEMVGVSKVLREKSWHKPRDRRRA